MGTTNGLQGSCETRSRRQSLTSMQLWYECMLLKGNCNNKFPGYKLSSAGTSKNHVAFAMGSFNFLPGIEEECSPIYKQAQSKEIPAEDSYLLFR